MFVIFSFAKDYTEEKIPNYVHVQIALSWFIFGLANGTGWIPSYFRKVTNANFMQLSHLTNYNGSNSQKPNRRMATDFQDNIVSILDCNEGQFIAKENHQCILNKRDY